MDDPFGEIEDIDEVEHLIFYSLDKGAKAFAKLAHLLDGCYNAEEKFSKRVSNAFLLLSMIQGSGLPPEPEKVG